MFTHFRAIFPSDKAFSLSPAGEKKWQPKIVQTHVVGVNYLALYASSFVTKASFDVVRVNLILGMASLTEHQHLDQGKFVTHVLFLSSMWIFSWILISADEIRVETNVNGEHVQTNSSPIW